METNLLLRIVLEKPPPDVDFGLQEGKGNDYKTVQTQKSKGGDLTFDCTVTVKLIFNSYLAVFDVVRTKWPVF